MMNYQQTFIFDADPFLKIGPTPPPMLPSLDQNEIEQTLYQRRVSDSNAEALTDSLQPLQISYTNQYYQSSSAMPAPHHHTQAVSYSPPAQQRSAPMNAQHAMLGQPHHQQQHHQQQQQHAVLFSKTPQAGTSSHISSMAMMMNKAAMTVAKPPETPSTPPPPPMLTKSISTPARTRNANNNNNGNAGSATAANSNTGSGTGSRSRSGTKPMLNAHSHSNPDIVAITPQSHAANLHNNSASNHSTASSNHTTATTVIESASAHSSHSPHPNNVNVAALGKSQPAPPVLANPLPPVNNTSSTATKSAASAAAAKLGDGIVIPMDQQNYNAFLSQVYGSSVPTVHGLGAHEISAYSRSNVAAYPSHSSIQDDLNEICYSSASALTAPTFNIYGAYDSQQYGIYNTSSTIASNTGYYTNQPVATSSYYAQPPHTAPAHVQYGGHSAAGVLPPKSADPYTGYHHEYGQATAPQTASYGYYHTEASHLASPPKAMPLGSPIKGQMTAQEEMQPENMVVHFLHRCDGTIISPHSDPMSVAPIMHSRGHKEDELDAFTAGDDALFGNNMVTIINVNWQTSIPYATVRIHISNRIHHVPLIDLTHIDSKHHALQQQQHGGNVQPHKHAANGKLVGNVSVVGTANGNANRYRLGGNTLGGHGEASMAKEGSLSMMDDVNSTADIGATVIRRNPKLSDETLMKLPHLRRHRDYIRSVMDTNMGPKDYNSFRVSVNTKNKDGIEEEDGGHDTMPHHHQQQHHHQHPHQQHQHQQQQQHAQHQNRHHQQHVNNNGNGNNNNYHGGHSRMGGNAGSGSGSGSGAGSGAGSGRTANIQNLNANHQHAGNLNAGNGRKKNKRMSACEKGDLFKTELCENWVKKGHCTYGKKCHFAHGRDDIRTRWRIENYKTQPCCDPARADSRLCLFGKRCNYAHPGEPLRRSHHCLYLDEEYEAEILKDYGSNTPYPFGIYI